MTRGNYVISQSFGSWNKNNYFPHVSNESLIQGAIDGDLKKVEDFLKDGGNINIYLKIPNQKYSSLDLSEGSLLMIAAYRGNSKLVDLLLSHGVL